VIASGLVPDANPITLSIRDGGLTLTGDGDGRTITIRVTGTTVTVREQA
jgi:hypothetical protein